MAERSGRKSAIYHQYELTGFTAGVVSARIAALIEQQREVIGMLEATQRQIAEWQQTEQERTDYPVQWRRP